MRTLSMLLALTLSSAAYSADCETEYPTDQLLTDLIEVEELLGTQDKAAILAKAKGMEAGLGCMTEALPPILIGRVYRAIGGGLFYAGEADRGKAWFMTALEVDPSYVYGIEDIGANHPIRGAYDELRAQPAAEATPIDGKTLKIGPKHLLDGKRLREAAATTGRPHLYQLEDEGIRSWVVEGNALPEEALDGAAVADAGNTDASKDKKEKPAKAPKQKSAKTAKAPKEKPEKTAKAPKEKPEKAGKEPKGKPAKEPKEAVAKAPKEKPAKPVKEKPVKTKAKPMVLQTEVIGRDRPPEQIPLIVTGALAVIGSGVLYGLSVSTKEKFDGLATWDTSGDPVARKALIQKQQAANRMFLGSFAVAAAGVSTLTYGITVNARTGRVMPTFNFRF